MTEQGPDGAPDEPDAGELASTPAASTPSIEVALDNDVILKSLGYGLSGRFWPALQEPNRVGILGVARFVLGGLVARRRFSRDADAVQKDLDMILTQAIELEPSDDELALAAEIELAATQKGVQVDGGESQLAAMTALRDSLLDTGDKRAIAGLEVVLDEVVGLEPIAGAVRCLEQVVACALVDEASATEVRSAVCREPTNDMTLSICFGCLGNSSPDLAAILDGLESYIGSLRRSAPRVLAN